MQLIKPKKLKKGDTVATVSLSWGGAGDKEILWRYNLGKQRLEKEFGLKVIEMENTLKGTDFLYNHPEKRAQDLMEAFINPQVKAIFSCIGGEESIRMLPYIDFDIIAKNPKIFIGYSDSTTTHLICLKAGISSFYGASLLAQIAENNKIFDYTAGFIQKVLFEAEPIGIVEPCKEWTCERIEWLEENTNVSKKMQKNSQYEFLQGSGVASGRLIGGCLDVLEMAKATAIWPEKEVFEGAILFFETSEEQMSPRNFRYILRNYATQQILQNASAIIFGKPCNEKYYAEYKEEILKVLSEFNINEIPVVYNMSFGHNEPMCILPFGALAQIDCKKKTFEILESGVC